MPEQVVILIIVAAFSIGKWVLDNVTKPAQENRPKEREKRSPFGPQERATPRSGPQASPADEEAERVRRFMEALGLPPGEVPPAPIRKKPVSQHPKPVRQEGVPVRPMVAPARPGPAPRPSVPTLSRPVLPEVSAPFAQPEMPPASYQAPAPAPLEPSLPMAAALAPAPPSPLESPAPNPRPYQVRTAHPAHSALRKALRQRSGLREALILSEVLGPPKALSGQ